jgi:ElaB/YqjD/DUF883 family membrane-anchored ribosome-binding protein
MASNPAQTATPPLATTVSQVSAQVASQADRLIGATQRAADTAGSSLHQGLDSLREELPFALSRASATADGLLAEGAERARETAQTLRSRAAPMQRQAQAYIREKPVQSVLLAVGVGALIMLLLGRSTGR